MVTLTVRIGSCMIYDKAIYDHKQTGRNKLDHDSVIRRHLTMMTMINCRITKCTINVVQLGAHLLLNHTKKHNMTAKSSQLCNCDFFTYVVIC